MRVESTASKPARSAWASSRYSKVLKILGALATLAVYSAALVIFGMALFRAIQPPSSGGKIGLRAGVQRFVSAGKNHLKSLRSTESFDRLHLDIKFKHLETLRGKRREAMDKGVLMASNDDFVPATIRHNGRSIKTKIRLKGDALDHLGGDKWSLRVKVRGGDQLFGMRRFSIQAPIVRDFQAEPIYLRHLRSEGVLTPRYQFVEVAINGKDIGVMAVEEHFTKELLESQRRREGVIMRFDEGSFWQNMSLNGTFGPYANPHVSTLKPFHGSKIAESPALQADFATAVGLMRGFMEGRLTPDEVFEVTLMARFMAVSEVWRTHHPLAWHNIRFYFNPLISRLEPVGFDGNVQAVIHEPGLVTTHGGFTPILLADDAFRDVFTRELARIAGDMADGTIIEWAEPLEAELVPRLQEGLQFIENMRFGSLMRRAKNLAAIDNEHFDLYLPPLGDPDMQYPEAVRGYLCLHCSPARVELVNVLPVPVIIESIKLKKKSTASLDQNAPTPLTDFPLELPATASMTGGTPAFIDFDRPADLKHFKVEFVTRVAGQTQSYELDAEPYFPAISENPLPVASLKEALATHAFLKQNPDSDGLLVTQGTWDVVAPLIIPPGLALTLAPGTELRFQEGGILVSTGSLHFEGTEELPIRLVPAPGNDYWGGLVSLRSDTPHVWRNVVVERTSGFQRVGWRLTGGVTLRRAEVKMTNSKFVGNRSEDALNLIRATFVLDGVDFHDTSSDALDADFSDGLIRGGSYSLIGGDGIDVSGAKIEVDGTRLVDIIDKALSVGEASQLAARNVHIERVSIGAASKDGSELTLEDSVIVGATTAGISVYTKKPVFGPARASVSRVEMQNVKTEALVQSGNRASIDGVLAEELPFDTDILY